MRKGYIWASAKAAHEANRKYCEAIGDYSQPDWEHAPGWQTDSAFAGVKFILANPDAGPDASHASWLQKKIEDGWKHGPVKDPEKKEHPCCVAYDYLPESQKAKDAIFGAVVRGVIAHYKAEGEGEAAEREIRNGG